MCILSVYTLLKVVGFSDLRVLSMSVMVSKKKSLVVGWVGGLSSIQFCFGFLEFFKLCKAPYSLSMNQNLSVAYPFPDVAALMDLLYISRSSAVRPTLQTLATIQSSTSFSQDLFCLPLNLN